MAQLIKFKRSTGSGVPSGLVTGELAYSGGRSQLFIGASSGSKVVVDASILNSATSTVAANVALKDGEGAGANTFTLKGSNAITGDVAFTLPATLPGSGNSQLLVDSSGAIALGDGNISNLQDIANIDQGGVTVDDILIWDNSASEWKHITQGEYNALFGLGPATNQAFNNVTLTGNLNVEGTNAILDASTVTVRDKSIIMGVGTITTDITTSMTAGVINLGSGSAFSGGDSIFVEDGNAYVPEGVYNADESLAITVANTHETGTYTHNAENWTWVSMTDTTTFTLNQAATVHLLMVGRGGFQSNYGGGGAGGEMEYHKDLSVAAGTYNVVVDNGTSGTPGVHVTELGLFAAKGSGGNGSQGSPSPSPYRGGNYFEDGVSLYEGGANQYGGEAGSGAGSSGAGGASINGSTGGQGGPGTADGGTVRDRNNGNANTTLQITGGHYAGYSGGGRGTNNSDGAYSGTSHFGGGSGTSTSTSGAGIVILTYLTSTPGEVSIDTGQPGVTQADFPLTMTTALTDSTISGAGITISGTTDKTIQWHQSGGGYSDRFVLTGGSLSITSGDASTTLKLGETQEFISVDQGGAAGSLNSAVTVSFDAVDDDDEFDFGSF
jgi:hypothetical protein